MNQKVIIFHFVLVVILINSCTPELEDNEKDNLSNLKESEQGINVPNLKIISYSIGETDEDAKEKVRMSCFLEVADELRTIMSMMNLDAKSIQYSDFSVDDSNIGKIELFVKISELVKRNGNNNSDSVFVSYELVKDSVGNLVGAKRAIITHYPNLIRVSVFELTYTEEVHTVYEIKTNQNLLISIELDNYKVLFDSIDSIFNSKTLYKKNIESSTPSANNSLAISSIEKEVSIDNNYTKEEVFKSNINKTSDIKMINYELIHDSAGKTSGFRQIITKYLDQENHPEKIIVEENDYVYSKKERSIINKIFQKIILSINIQKDEVYELKDGDAMAILQMQISLQDLRLLYYAALDSKIALEKNIMLEQLHEQLNGQSEKFKKMLDSPINY